MLAGQVKLKPLAITIWRLGKDDETTSMKIFKVIEIVNM